MYRSTLNFPSLLNSTLWQALDAPHVHVGTGSTFGQADVIGTGSGVVLELNLPGVAKDDVEVTIENGQLRVQVFEPAGAAVVPDGSQAETATGVEEPARTATLTRLFRLPQALDLDTLSASLENGQLTVRVEKHTEIAPRKIAIG